MTKWNRAYLDQILGPLNDAWSCGSVCSEGTSVGASESASVSETLESLIGGLDEMGPREVGGRGSVSDGI